MSVFRSLVLLFRLREFEEEEEDAMMGWDDDELEEPALR